MYMYQKGLVETIPESLGKRLSAIQATLKEEHGDDEQSNMLELRAVVKGKAHGMIYTICVTDFFVQLR